MNKLIIAAAGAGKTTYLMQQALETNANVLITTFTIENTECIRQKFINKIGYVPNHVTIQTWFSFLIQHGVKPFQGSLRRELFEKTITGLHFCEQQSGINYYIRKRNKKIPILFNENEEFMQHYFDRDMRIFSDKLSKFVCRANNATGGKVVERISKIFPNIFIDEVQDLSGYDLTLIDLLFRSSANILLVGDPRQTTYLTHWEKKNQKYHFGKITDFIKNECRKSDKIIIDTTTLNCSHRNNESICNFSSLLYNNFPVTSICTCETCHPKQQHEGIYAIQEKEVYQYIKLYNPTILRYNSKKEVGESNGIFTFGSSKGREFNDVLIFPTEKMEKWLVEFDNSIFEPTTKAKFYVAITRARFSVAFVVSEQIFESLKSNLFINTWRKPI